MTGKSIYKKNISDRALSSHYHLITSSYFLIHTSDALDRSVLCGEPNHDTLNLAAFPEELDGSPFTALSIASQTVNAGGNWVQCDKCTKWNLLPHNISTERLPDSWSCGMKTWDPSRATCSGRKRLARNPVAAAKKKAAMKQMIARKRAHGDEEAEAGANPDIPTDDDASEYEPAQREKKKKRKKMSSQQSKGKQNNFQFDQY